MKPAELKKEYIRLRAEGKSYSYICEQLHISKSTCTKWEKALAAEIDELKRAELAELCESYSMTKEARIKKLGDTLDKINAALEQALRLQAKVYGSPKGGVYRNESRYRAGERGRKEHSSRFSRSSQPSKSRGHYHGASPERERHTCPALKGL